MKDTINIMLLTIIFLSLLFLILNLTRVFIILYKSNRDIGKANNELKQLLVKHNKSDKII